MLTSLRNLFVVSTILSFGLSNTAIAAVYKCKSADGKMSFQSMPCKKDQESIKNRIGGDSAESESSDSASIYGTWFDIEKRDSGMIISSSGAVNFYGPGVPSIVGKLTKTGDNKYHIEASIEDFDLSSDLTHDLETGEITLKMGPSVTSRFKKK